MQRSRSILPSAAFLGALGILQAAGAFAQAPSPAAPAAQRAPLVNARVETRSMTRALAAEVQAVADRGTAAWVAYRVPIAPRLNGRVESSQWCCGRCRLEPPTALVVLARVESREVVELRAEGVDCDIDAAGMPVVWFEAVDPDQSVTWLSSLLGDARATAARTTRDEPRVPASRIRDRALTAIALHAAPSAAPALVTIARQGATTNVRGQALFWLAQRAADQAVPAITNALDNDPDIEVKKKAVFALSQLPRDESIPRLIELARTHRVTEVRRQAMFWLGQSRDPKAVDFFEAVLLRR